MQFVGQAEYALDKKRVPVPPLYRAAFKAGGYITTGTGPYLILYTLDSWEKAVALIEALPAEDEDAEEARRDFFGNAVPVAPDAQGRVQLLDSHITHAELEREVIVVGTGRRLEIWDRAGYLAREAQRQAARKAATTKSRPEPGA